MTTEWQHRIVDTIVATERELGVRHLISLNIANGRAKVEKPHPEVSIFNFHYCVPPDTVAMNYGLKKVIGENETGFRGRDDILYRTEGWDFLLAGGGLYNNLDYSFTPDHPDGSFRAYRSPGGGSPELRNQLGILKRFLESFDFIRMHPDRSVIQSVSPSLTTYALVRPGEAYAIYLHVPLPHKPERIENHLRTGLQASLRLRLPPGHYAVTWIDPLDGKQLASASLVHGEGSAELETPVFDNDLALAIRRRDR